MKTNIFNHNYDIIDDITIQIKTTARKSLAKQVFEPIAGKYKLMATYNGRKLENISLFLPSFASQMYSYESVSNVTEGIDTIKCILTSNNLRHPLNEKIKQVELYDNGILIKNNYVDIHPAYFFGKTVGFLFNLV